MRKGRCRHRLLEEGGCQGSVLGYLGVEEYAKKVKYFYGCNAAWRELL